MGPRSGIACNTTPTDFTIRISGGEAHRQRKCPTAKRVGKCGHFSAATFSYRHAEQSSWRLGKVGRIGWTLRQWVRSAGGCVADRRSHRRVRAVAWVPKTSSNISECNVYVARVGSTKQEASEGREETVRRSRHTTTLCRACNTQNTPFIPRDHART